MNRMTLLEMAHSAFGTRKLLQRQLRAALAGEAS
jgi:hypothetical protein